MKQNQNTRRANQLFTLAALLVVLISNVFVGRSQTTQSDTVWSKYIGSEVKAVKFSPDGQFIYAAALGRGPLKLRTETGEILTEYDTYKYEATEHYSALDISSDGKWLIGGDYGNNMFIINTENGDLIKALSIGQNDWLSNKFNTVEISSDNKYIIATNRFGIGDSPMNAILIWDMEQGIEPNKIIISSDVMKVSISSDLKHFAVCYTRGKGSTIDPSEIELYSLETFELISILGKHQSLVSDISFSPDGSLLASCGWDGFIKIWDVKERKLVRESNKFKRFKSVIFISNEYIIGGSNDDLSSDLYVWNLNNNNQFTSIPVSRPNDLNYNEINKEIVIGDFESVTLLNWDKILDIKELPKLINSVLIYPNPTSGIVNIPIDCQTASKYEIFNTSGELIKSKEIATELNNFLIIDFTQYDKGVYFVNVHCLNVVLNFQVVKGE